MSHKLGVQFQWDDPEVVSFCEKVKPVAAMAIEVDKADFLARIRPHVEQLLWRHWPNRAWADNPELRATQTIDHVRARVGHLIQAGLVTMITDNNEYIMEGDRHLHDAADRYMSSVVALAEAELGVGVAVGNLNTGHYWDGSGDSVSVLNAFPRTMEILNVSRKSCLAVHEYDWDSLDRAYRQSGEYYLVGRFQRIMEPVLARYPNVRCAITELGIDYGVIEWGAHRGWRWARDNYQEALELFCGSHGLEWANALYGQDWFWFALIFGCGMGPDWRGRGFDISGTEVGDRVASFPSVPVPPVPPEPPPSNGGDEMESIRVWKWDEATEKHIELTALADKQTLVKGKYGVEFRRAKVAAGQQVYRLRELWEKVGGSALISQVLAGGQPMANVDVAFYWPDAPDPPDPPTAVYTHDWYGNFVHGPTNINGDVGPGMGKGAYHGIGEGGPHAVWVRDPNIPSDICEKLGMLSGTMHHHLDQKFYLEAAGTPPSPGGNGGNGAMKFVEIGREQVASDHSYIRLFPDGTHNFWDCRGDLTCGSWVSPEPVHPKKVNGSPCLEFDITYPEQEDRVYMAYIQDPVGNTLGGPFACQFEAGQKCIWNVTVTWRSEEPPSPPTPTPTGGLGDRIRAVVTELQQIANEADMMGQVVSIEAIMGDGSRVTFAPKASVASRIVAAVTSLLKR